MARHPRSLALSWFVGGALFAATLGAPLVGAASALFWRTQDGLFDGWGDDTLAARHVSAALDEGWGVPQFPKPPGPTLQYWVRPDTRDKRDCDTQLRIHMTQFEQEFGSAFGHAYSAIVRGEQNSAKLDANLAAERALLRLPPLVLGALSQCMEHSLLSVGCASIARRRLSSDKAVQANIAAQLLANAKRGNEQVCLLLNFAQRGSAKQPAGLAP